MLSRNSNSGQAVKLQLKFPAKKKTVTVDTDEQTFNLIMTMDIHKLALAKNGQVEFERQAEEQKQREAL